MAVKKSVDAELEDAFTSEEEEDDEGTDTSIQDEIEEAELDTQIKDMVQEFLAIPEVKGLVTEIAKDAVKRASDGVRNEAYNKVQKAFDSQFAELGTRFQALEQAVGIEHEAGTAEGAGTAVEPEVVRRRVQELDKRAKELEEREKDIATKSAETTKAGLESYRKGVVTEFGLQRVSHLVHGESEDEIDDSVVEARKSLNVMRRDFIKEFKEKGWTPPPEDLGEEAVISEGGEPAAGDLRSRFHYGPPQGQSKPNVV